MNTGYSHLLKKLSMIMLILLSFSCVGTIEDTAVSESEGEEAPEVPFSFAGAEEAVAIAHDKVELYFFPSSLSIDLSTYIIIYDGLQVPITVPGTSLTTDYRGLFRFVVEGLTIDTNYVFKVQVRDDLSLIESATENVVEVRTFPNITADFAGLSIVTNRPGLDGINSVEVEWPEATRTGSVFVPDEGDPIEYSITLIDKNALTPADFHNEAFGAPERKVVVASGDKRSTVVNGLTGDTEYYVNVRAIHQGFSDFGSNVSYKKEENLKYLEIKTLAAGVAGIEFDPASLNLDLAGGSTGLSTVIAQWEQAVGAFDHYRVYYATQGTGVQGHTPDSNCNGPEDSNNNIICKKIPFTETDTFITDLSAHTTYETMLVVCQSVACGALERKSSNVVNIKTTPPIADFDGIVTIDHARSEVEINTIHLNIASPDFSSGVIDGIIFEYIAQETGQVFQLNDPTVTNTHPSLEVAPFDYTSETDISITGINPYALEALCFIGYPYILEDGNVNREENGAIEKCITPTIIPPTVEEFTGAGNCIGISGGVTVLWSEPTSGVYSKFEVIIKEGSTGFNFNDAISGDSAYTRELVSKTKNNHTFEDLDPAKDYQVGVITYFFGNGTAFRSEGVSGSILTCSPN